MRKEAPRKPRRISPKQKYLICSYLCHIFDTMSDGLYITNKNGMTLSVNAMYENLTGLKAEDLIGKNVKDLVETGVFDLALNSKVVKTKKAATAVQQTNMGRKVVLMAHPIFDYDEDVELVVTFVRDIALISQLKDQVAAQKQLIEQFKHEIHQMNDSLYLEPSSEVMVNLFSQIKRVAKTDATILFLGETGVGKDVMAREVHDKSQRKDEPFFKVDCTSIPENLVESELFGYAPGAFSGADSRGKVGMFEMADRGTLFLDEIGELPLSMQAKLLRALQNGEIQRVGATKAKNIDVRIIAATNRDLRSLVAQGLFREDLFYRLNVVPIRIPPLRERIDDIPDLVTHFLGLAADSGLPAKRIGADALTALKSHHWPGNVRELENLVQRVCALYAGEDVTADVIEKELRGFETVAPGADAGDGNGLSDAIERHLAKYFAAHGDALPPPGLYGRLLKELERPLIVMALSATHGNQIKAAALLGLNRNTLRKKMRDLGLRAVRGVK